MRRRTSEGLPQTAQPATATVRIERIVAGGFGLARHEGRVLLVPMTAPGDLVEVTLPGRGPRTELVRLIEPGPDRVVPLCRHYGECGGCDLMHLSYEAQLSAKLDLIADVMQRIGAVTDLPGLAIVPNPKPFGSRIRATWRPTAACTAGYLRRRSHEVVPIEHCPILDPALETTRSALRITGPAQGLTNSVDSSVAGGGNDASEIEFTVVGERMRASADSFFQASLSLLDEFVARVIHEAARDCPDHVLELYAGIGLFTVPLGRRVGWIESVESRGAAVALARRNIRVAGLTNVTVHESTVGRWLVMERRLLSPKVVIVDPPRAGLSSPVAERLIALGPARLVYVSCDPATFARDARKLGDAGYRLAGWTAFDHFPQTHHVELVARFERTGH